MKKFLYFIVSLVVLLLVLLIGGIIFLPRFLTPELITSQLESNLNCRAEIKKVDINLFSIFGSVGLEGLSLAQRDSFADKATPIAERSPLSSKIFSIDKTELKLSFLPLLTGNISLEKFLLKNLSLNLVLYNEGGNNIVPLFQKPKIVKGSPNPALTETEKKEEPIKEPGEAKKPFKITDLPVSASLKMIGLEKARIDVLYEKTGQRFQIDPMDLIISSIEIDPKDLEKKNSIKVNLDLNFKVIGKEGKQTAGFLFSALAGVRPFTVPAGELNPSQNLTLILKKGSYFDSLTILDALSSTVPFLGKAGVKLDSIQGKGELGQDAELQINYTAGKITILKEAIFHLTKYQMILANGSWIIPVSREHSFQGFVQLTKPESDDVNNKVDVFLKNAAKGGDVSSIKKQLLAPITKDGLIALPFLSSGDIKSPTVALNAKLPTMEELLKGAVIDAVKGQIKDQINKNLPGEAQDLIKKIF